MKKFVNKFRAYFMLYHLRLRNNPIRQANRSANYSLNEFNVNKTTLRISLVGMTLLAIITFIVVA